MTKENTMKEVQVTVYDKQIYESHSDENENKYRGNLAFKNDNIYITYKEEEQKITTMIKVKDGVVNIKRLGAIKGDLEFSTNKSSKSLYSTPYGQMELEIITNKCDVYLLEKGVKIYIEYKIMMQGSKVSENVYLIVTN